MALENEELKFNEEGLLPPGCHEITLQDIKSIFVDGFPDSQTRQSRFECFIKFYKDLLDNVKSCISIIIDGSFVENEIDPFDIDFLIIVDDSKRSNAEVEYLEKIHKTKERLKKNYILIRDKIESGKWDESFLYKLDFYNYGCDFFVLYELEKNHIKYKNYLSDKDSWIKLWSKNKDKNQKGLLKLNVYYEGDLDEL